MSDADKMREEHRLLADMVKGKIVPKQESGEFTGRELSQSMGISSRQIDINFVAGKYPGWTRRRVRVKSGHTAWCYSMTDGE